MGWIMVEVLRLAGRGETKDERCGLVNDLCVPSLLVPAYAPPGAVLISATVLGIPAIDDHQLESSVADS